MKVIRARVTIVSAALVVVASVSYVHLAAKVTTHHAVFKASVQPKLTYRFIDPLNSHDSFDMSDGTSFDTTKVRSDVIATTDRIDYKNMTKVLADGFAMHDDIRPAKLLVIDSNTSTEEIDPDPVSMSEIVALNLSRPNIADTVQVTDVTLLHPELSRSDAVVVSDTDAKTITKVLTDSIAMSDSVSVLNVPTRNFQDNPTMTDVATLYVQEGTYHAFNEYAFNQANIN